MVNAILTYTARGGAETGTGLTCTVNIYKLSDESQVVINAAMNEVGVTGEYVYTYAIPDSDNYLAIMNCSEKPSEKRTTFNSTTAGEQSIASGAGWATTTVAYELSGLTTDDVSSITMADLCERADLQVENDIFTFYTDVRLNVGPDGSRTQFQIKVDPSEPLGDRDRSSSSALEAESAGDITVYTVTHNSSTGFDESTILTVSSINSARDGRFTLSSAPASNGTLYADYVTFPKKLKFQTIRTAASYLAAHFALLVSMGAEIPSGYSYKIGKFSITKGEKGTMHKMLENTWNSYENALKNIAICEIEGV